MMRRRCFFMLIGLFACGTAWAVGDPTPEELEQNRRRLTELRQNAEQIDRLRKNLKAFRDLPEKRREAIARLDYDLHELPVKKRDRLTATLARYADWLERLRDKDPQAYQAIKDAPDATSRLALIKDRRDREWMETQPRVQRDEWQKRQGVARAEFVAKLRQDESAKHERWLIAKRFWSELETKKPMPSRLSDYPEKVRKYVEEYLVPTLTADEREKLVKADGLWPEFPQALVEVASKRPSALPPDPPRKVSQLPKSVHLRLVEAKKGGIDAKKSKALDKELHTHEGPSFASNAVRIGLRENRLPFAYEYLAPNYASLQKPMKEFVDKKLGPLLDQGDHRKLSDSQAKWPDYPKTIQELAQKHNLQPPWHILPDADVWKWDWYRNSKARSWGAEIAKEKKGP